MPINDDLSPFEALAALSRLESQPLQRRHMTNMRETVPSGSLRGIPPGTSSEEDTPVYWQTVQAMSSGAWQRDR